MVYGSLFKGIGVTLIILGIGFSFFSSFYIDGYLPAAVVLKVIGHYLVSIAIGVIFIAVGVLMVVFGVKRS